MICKQYNCTYSCFIPICIAPIENNNLAKADFIRSKTPLYEMTLDEYYIFLGRLNIENQKKLWEEVWLNK